ncbi:MAG TPA: alanine/ornithine racemase family PLP-dependent enzyme [Pseudothermotoga sp.]|nr:alanine/ornithine racemase family PLP-dependent enzyme [Pseudothermotoga sp.]HOK82923.1 alanine/ornithine racemase family PLP-dependent enzyme [Pseudothermotoga sp.]HPP69903.1 alanine/ornithine racemase family PLP-dependent enzyme [Pseudothermotoga sp.]
MPRLYIHLQSIEENARRILERCSKYGVEVVGVTKVSLGDPKIAQTMKDAGIRIIGESRIDNIVRLRKEGIDGPFMMIRIPQKDDLPKTLDLCEYALVSELKTIEWMDEIAHEMGKSISVIYMVDVGDLREGAWYKDAVEEIAKAVKMAKKIQVVGVGTNLGCYGGVLPSERNLGILVQIRDIVEKKSSCELPIVSGGNTAALKLLEEGKLPFGVNQYRIGEAIFLGTDVTNNRQIQWLRQDAIVLEAQIIELKTKPSFPEGETGQDAFGRKPAFVDKGIRRRAILALGEQDILSTGLRPLDNGAEVIHASSDHTIVDVSDVERRIEVGDTMRFTLSYGALLRAMTCPHVEKIYV